MIKYFSSQSHLFQTGEEKTNKTTNMSFPNVNQSKLDFWLNINVNAGHLQTYYETRKMFFDVINHKI